MSRLRLGALALALVFPLPALAADHQDLIYVGPGGPLRLRLHLQGDGKPLAERWQAYVDRVFKHFDVDGNGSLDAKEFARLAAFPFGSRTGNALADVDLDGDVDLLRGGAFKFADADANKDGKITADEVRAILQKNGSGPIAVSISPVDSGTQQLSDALLKQLDTDADGKLSQAEAEAATQLLARLDLDEDEIITRAEVLEQPQPNARAPRAVPNGAEDPEENGPSGDFLIVAPTEPVAATAKRFIERLGKTKGKDKPTTLSRAESGFDEKRFAALDKDGNGKLDATELAAWLAQPLDIEFRIALSSKAIPDKKSGADVWSAEGELAPLASKVHKGDDGILRLELSGAVIGVAPGPEIRTFREGANQFIIQQFRELAGEKKFLERKQLRDSPQLQGFGPFFDNADRNSDGKLDMDELQTYLKLIEEGANMQVLLRVSDGGRSLFEKIDADHDGRLSVRELRNAWKVLSAYDTRGDKKIGIDQLPHGYAITPDVAALASANFGGRFALRTSMAVDRPRRQAVGPEWFLKMDRNGDGDVSPREFLGTLELFRKLDKDGDGLISAAEAIAAEKLKAKSAKD